MAFHRLWKNPGCVFVGCMVVVLVVCIVVGPVETDDARLEVMLDVVDVGSTYTLSGRL